MSRSAVARNYADALRELASRKGAEEEYGELLRDVADLYRDELDFRRFLDTPRVPMEAKKEAVRTALGPDAPRPLLRFLLIVLEKRRHRVLPEIAAAYRDLVDAEAGRVRATVSLAFDAEEPLRAEIVEGLERALDADVVATFRREPALIGGVRVRIGDRVMDGSIRRRMEDLRRELVRGITERGPQE